MTGFTVDGKAFAQALAKVSKASARRDTVKVLRGVSVTILEGELELACTDMDHGMIVTVPASVGYGCNGTIVLADVRALATAVKGLAGDVTVTLFDEGATVTNAGTTLTWRTFPTEDYPAIPYGWTEQWKAPYSTLSGMLAGVSVYSKDPSRPVLTGVFVDVGASTVRFAATDSYRLHVETIERTEPLTYPRVPWAGIIPGASLALFIRAAKIARQDPEITFGTTDSHAWLSTSEVQVWARLIQGQFPHIDQLRPEEGSFTGTYRPDVGSIVPALRRFAKNPSGKNKPARLVLVDDDAGCTMTLNDNNGTVGVETVPGVFTGEPLEIGFNSGFLADAVESLASSSVDMALINPLRPALLTNGKPDCWRLVMPVKLA